MDLLNPLPPQGGVPSDEPGARSRDRRARRWSWGCAVALLAALAVAMASCFAAGPAAPAVPTFPHDVHVRDRQLACTFCHVTVLTADMPSMPPPELCAPCHDAIDAEKPADRRIEAFYEPGGRYRRAAPGGLTEEIVFAHRAHAGLAQLPCDRCHGEIAASAHMPTEPVAWKRACMDCHAAYGRDNSDCAGCHRQIDRDWRPPSHDGSWTGHHGWVVRSQDRASANRCELCHDAATSCQACHQTVAPRDHNQYFRLRGHGVMAAIDRSRCHVCHRTDTCEQCHSATRPLSHRGGFGDPLQRHCTQCHFPLGDNGCAVCHRSTPSHAEATPLPPTHHPAMNCRLCHGNGQPLPHPDGGHPCTACHK